MRQRRETVEHPFGTMKARMGATHFLTKTLPKVAAEMALSVLAYNLTRVMNIVGAKPLMAAIAALRPNRSWLLTNSLRRCFYTAKGRWRNFLFRPLNARYKSSICEGHIEVPNWERKSGRLPMVQLTSPLDIPRGSKINHFAVHCADPWDRSSCKCASLAAGFVG